MNKVELQEDLKQYITQTFIQNDADCIVLRFPNSYMVLISKKSTNEHATAQLFLWFNRMKELYFKNNEDLNVFLRETLERK
ncbi:hypothetical protein EII25_03485 [Erysipelotrichaceae bacterium OH741_COT-311]|nr:hypothetical protein EII25_03485 [Erysipelotrichaceae bacterium OH741_COT-311]